MGSCDALHNRNEIRRILNLDRDWSLYALADLDDDLFSHCDWWLLGDALALVFQGLAIKPIFVLGDPGATSQLLSSLPFDAGYLNLKPHQLEAAKEVYRYVERIEVQRMFLDSFTPRSGETVVLDESDCVAIEQLYASGSGGGVAFSANQLKTGFFRGVRSDGSLVAVAGAQVASRNEGVAAIGNIFVRADFRGRGLAQVVTSAVAAALLDVGIATIGLNVRVDNLAAIRAYERIGFRARFHYFEGPVERIY